MRTASLERNTAETQITLSLNLDGSGEGSIESHADAFRPAWGL